MSQTTRERRRRERTESTVYGYRLRPETHERIKALRKAREVLCVYRGGKRLSHDACLSWMLDICEAETKDEARRLGVDLATLAAMMGKG
ncbi:MAG: hypothetical protein ACX94C_11650 [Phycisphaerales bacterium]